MRQRAMACLLCVLAYLSAPPLLVLPCMPVMGALLLRACSLLFCTSSGLLLACMPSWACMSPSDSPRLMQCMAGEGHLGVCAPACMAYLKVPFKKRVAAMTALCSVTSAHESGPCKRLRSVRLGSFSMDSGDSSMHASFVRSTLLLSPLCAQCVQCCSVPSTRFGEGGGAAVRSWGLPHTQGRPS